MKIAIPTRNNKVDDHFGHCEYYTIFSISDKNDIEKMETFEAPQGCGCQSNIASILKEMGVKTMLAGNMGQGAINKISSVGIEVYRGCTGDVKLLVEDFLNDKITDSGETCQHHHGHEHGNKNRCNH